MSMNARKKLQRKQRKKNTFNFHVFVYLHSKSSKNDCFGSLANSAAMAASFAVALSLTLNAWRSSKLACWMLSSSRWLSSSSWLRPAKPSAQMASAIRTKWYDFMAIVSLRRTVYVEVEVSELSGDCGILAFSGCLCSYNLIGGGAGTAHAADSLVRECAVLQCRFNYPTKICSTRCMQYLCIRSIARDLGSRKMLIGVHLFCIILSILRDLPVDGVCLRSRTRSRLHSGALADRSTKSSNSCNQNCRSEQMWKLLM